MASIKKFGRLKHKCYFSCFLGGPDFPRIANNNHLEDIWTGSTSTASSISTRAIENIVNRLKNGRNRGTTKRTYYNIWKNFNQFIIKLDRKSPTWEERIVLYVGYLVNQKRKSNTIKSYISAIRSVLRDDGVILNEDKYLLTSLTKACRLINDQVMTRLPIQRGVLGVIIKHVKEYFITQPYLEKLFSALFASAYFGLLRVGEITQSEHVVLACNVHI